MVTDYWFLTLQAIVMYMYFPFNIFVLSSSVYHSRSFPSFKL